MRKFGVFFLVFLCLLHCSPLLINAAAEPITANCSGLQAGQGLAEMQTYTCNAEAAILFELDTETMVYALQPDLAVAPTDLAKLMVVLLAVEDGDLQEMVTVQAASLETVPIGAKLIGLLAGETLTVRDLIYCVMMTSANDATAVLTEHLAGDQQAFVEKMNERAATMGCTQTHFTNVFGSKEEGQTSTARDLAIMMAQALRNEEFSTVFSAVNYELPSDLNCYQTLVTSNDQMAYGSSYYDERVTGGKTASISATSHSMICTAETDAGRYLCILIGTASSAGPFSQARKLFNLGFDNYAVQPVRDDGPYGMFSVKNGENSVVVGPADRVYALLPIKFDAALISFQVVENRAQLSAPVKEGTAVGSLQICYETTVIGEVDLLARHDVLQKGTTIQTVGTEGSGRRLWRGVGMVFGVLIGVPVAGFVVLLTLRQINISRHKKRKDLRRRRGRERVHELE